MGNVFSSTVASERNTEHVTFKSVTLSNTCDSPDMEEEAEQFHDTIDEDINDDEARAKAKEDEMVEFRKQLDIKREQRKQILARHRSEKEELEKALEKERKSKLELYESNKHLRELLANNKIDIPESLQSNKENLELTNTILQMKEEFENLRSNNIKLRKDLAESNSSLQNAFTDIAELNAQNIESMKHINALKEVVTVSKTMINLREQQLSELKNKLSEIERSLADRETSMLSSDLRQEYERQLQNIRTLRGLYEERARLSEVTRLGLIRELEEQKSLYQAENAKCKSLTSKVEELEAIVDSLHEKLENKNNQISTHQNEISGLQSEMAVVNKLFSQVLLGYKTKQDLDKLVHRLEENHGILTQMAEKENDSEASTALPKLLLELVSQVDEDENSDHNAVTEEKEKEENSSTEGTAEGINSSHTTPEEIVENLPKVWRVLMELLSHQSVTEVNATEKVTTCYKSVQTKSGPVLVPSVSQTYIRLKDLIIEKLGLVKEVNRMKQLNVHLETRLEEQERRLCLVTSELSKTWHVVGRLRRHHHQLHTHEKILKYELQQKRKMLNELKEELEYCREKWIQAREKNTQSEKDWRVLRAEFSSRNAKADSPSCNNSAESGYSDERPSDESSESNDESEYIAEPLIRCKKKNKKSFDTMLDSSTDINLVAEREDPSSDMLEVADLPLDTQDSSHSEDILKSDKTCDETEDEIGEIINESYLETNPLSETNEGSNISRNDHNVHFNHVEETNPIRANPTTSTIKEKSSSNTALINPSEILKNIKMQKDRLAEKDKKMEKLEKDSAALLTKTKNTTIFCEQINNTLDCLIHRSSTADQVSKNINMINVESETGHESATKLTEETDNEIHDCIVNEVSILKSIDVTEETNNNIIGEFMSDSAISHNAIESQEILKQDTKEANSFSNTEVSVDSAEPSTSHCLNHEARFAARDQRLKRLEEQTKSLVNKVNKTTTKGVKIHYKLEELHNIYGSENSRAGTPSDDAEDKSLREEDSPEE
ncbi:thyroid receptor-interacting protein 11 [Amyelois transitella]|uniref:thyroid receptor-interacting protein 11 n=1 Tax=Amyelois transitella TaxID=680683 RepID=UPI00298FAAD4|nr:thyroid receptor-interacting protein 11 [Amyelois transitella]